MQAHVTAIFFQAETSLVIKNENGYLRVLTFTWGFSVGANEFTKLEPLLIKDIPSEYHSSALSRLNVEE